jgi:hypothetical protein
MRAVQGQVRPNVDDDASDGIDDDMVDVLNDRGPERALLSQMLAAMSEAELHEVIALLWIGRGDYEPEEWDRAVENVPEYVNEPPVDYVLGTPLAAEHIEEGLEQMSELAEAVDEDETAEADLEG